MSSWSRRRKLNVAILVIFAGLVLAAIPVFALFYKPASCSDGIMNGRETGVDCGGKCVKLCQSDFLPASVAWTRFEELAPGLYNIAAYIVNPNADGEAVNAPYRMSMFDNRGELVGEFTGRVTIPPHRNTLAFQSAIAVGKSVPSKIAFEFTAPPVWQKSADKLKSLVIGNKDYAEEGNASSLSIDLRNPTVETLPRMSVYAILYDGEENAIGFSKTIIDEIAPQSSAVAPFTWPRSRDGKVVSIEVLPVAE